MKKVNTFFLSLLVIIILSASNIVHSQTYVGGSASVQVKNSDGKYRFINVVVTHMISNYKSSSATKSDLDRAISSEKKYNENFATTINYDLDVNEGGKFGGSASASVKDKSGNSRIVNTSIRGMFETKGNISEAKAALLSKLKVEKRYDEEFVYEIEYDIEKQ